MIRHFTQTAYICIFILALGLPDAASAQEYNIVHDQYIYNQLEKTLYTPGAGFHTSIRPYRYSDVARLVNPDTLAVKGMEQRKSWGGRKLFDENFLRLDSTEFQLYLDPLFAFDAGKDFSRPQNTWTNSRGLQVFGSIGKKVSFYTAFWENQAQFVSYVDSFVRNQNVVPGQGRVKPFGNGFDYAWASGYVSYSPSRFFNFQAGNDKQFIGNGYRSLLLSDNAFNNPFLKITTSVWRLKYVNLFTAFQNVGSAANSGLGGYQKKYGSFHYLDINIGKRLNVGLFEAVIWQSVDTTGQRRQFDVNYFNPIIFYRPVEYSLGSPDNVLLGLNASFIFMKNNVLYGQLMLDEFSLKEVRAGNGWWGNKQGFQLGVKIFNLFGASGLSAQSEFNYVRPYTYGHYVATQSYTHFAQPLAHPLMANFMESVNFLRFRHKRFSVEGKILLAQYGADSAGSQVGHNIFAPVAETYNQPTSVPSIYGNRTLQGVKNTLLYTDLTVGYLINRRTNMRVELSISKRIQHNPYVTQTTNWVWFGIRTALPNRYYDF